MVRYRDIVGDGGSDIARQLETFKVRLAQRLMPIEHVILVMSGKGGVGKSSVTVNLATSFAMAGRRVGVLDGDIYGPSIPKMMGLPSPELIWRDQGLEPALGPMAMPVMSLEFLLKDETIPVTWDGPTQEAFTYRGNLEFHALREMLADTVWGELDLLLIDLPPGTNQATTLCGLLPKLTGILMVSMPTEVSRMVVNRALALVADVLKARLLGVVENMCGYVNVETGDILPLFAPESSSYRHTAVLAHLPFDYRMARACDDGVPFVTLYEGSPTAGAFVQLRERVSDLIFHQAEV